MNEHGLIYSPPMVLATLDGRKTRTRRLDPRWLKVKKGDRLWVRETLMAADNASGSLCVAYRADGAINPKLAWQWRDDRPLSKDGRGWDTNPEVVVLSLKLIECKIRRAA